MHFTPFVGNGFRIILILLAITSVCITFDPLINRNSSPSTKALYSFLISQYGKSILSGQTSFHYTDLVNRVGKQPLVQAFDMQNYSPHNPWFNWQPYDDGTI